MWDPKEEVDERPGTEDGSLCELAAVLGKLE